MGETDVNNDRLISFDEFIPWCAALNPWRLSTGPLGPAQLLLRLQKEMRACLHPSLGSSESSLWVL